MKSRISNEISEKGNIPYKCLWSDIFRLALLYWGVIRKWGWRDPKRRREQHLGWLEQSPPSDLCPMFYISQGDARAGAANEKNNPKWDHLNYRKTVLFFSSSSLVIFLTLLLVAIYNHRYLYTWDITSSSRESYGGRWHRERKKRATHTHTRSSSCEDGRYWPIGRSKIDLHNRRQQQTGTGVQRKQLQRVGFSDWPPRTDGRCAQSRPKSTCFAAQMVKCCWTLFLFVFR